MKRILISILSMLLLLVFAGCQAEKSSGINLINGKPEWFFAPSKEGRIGGVGVSGVHVDGKTGQKSLATQRALEEIARQMGVKVQSFSSLKSVSDTSSGTTTSGETSSFFTVDGTEVRARIEAIWEDPYTQELYIWMVAQ